ncbi:MULTISPECIES: APC family permease [Caballeronia]|uniref:APC family permease n=1 Tax=Caballeronia TaxID=1827195 RepID=UPI001FCF8217|nr:MULTISPECIES: APC family permease [Caballeronia]MDR5799120.1 APC family permease [Caballeronia sp. LZ001]
MPQHTIVNSPVTERSGAAAEELHPSRRLTGRIGLFELLCTVLAYSAPVAVVSGFIPFVIYFDGSGAPAVFLIATLILLPFTVGFTTMAKYVPNPGAFYAFITSGLGRTVGLGAAFLAMFGYMLLGFTTLPFNAVNSNMLITGTFGGREIAWYWYGLLFWLLSTILSYFRIDLSAKVLTVAMTLEVVIVAVYDVAVGFNGGPEGLSLAPFSFLNIGSGSLGIAILFAITCFLGFEATAVFRDEVRNPDKTVPLAAYSAVLLIGGFYAISAWALVIGFGVHGVGAAANKDAAGMFATSMSQYVGKVGVDCARVLVVTSIFASTISTQSVVSRYVFKLGADGVLPRFLGAVHPKHKSPYVASFTVSLVWLVLGVIFTLAKTDPTMLYARVAGVGAFVVLVLMAMTSIAVVVFFGRAKHIRNVSVLRTVILPILSAVSLTAVLILAIKNFDTLIGGSPQEAIELEILTGAIFVVGVCTALYYRARKPRVYRMIGAGEAPEHQVL